MKRVILIATAVVLAVLAAMVGRPAAQETNTQERTFLTFSGAVEMPGLRLEPGTYVFKLADSPSRNVVQVWNQDEDNMLGHWLFVQAERPVVTEDNVIMFRETAEGTTPAVQYWYFPGEKVGKEFVYPKDQATRIAQRTGQNVLTTEGDITSTSSVSSVDAQGNVTEWQRESAESRSAGAEATVEGQGVASAEDADSTVKNAPASAQPTAPAGSLAGNRGLRGEAEVETQAAAPSPEPRSAVPERGAVGTSGDRSARSESSAGISAQDEPSAQIARAEELPRTASPLPLSGLIGLLSLAGAAGLRALRR